MRVAALDLGSVYWKRSYQMKFNGELQVATISFPVIHMLFDMLFYQSGTTDGLVKKGV